MRVAGFFGHVARADPSMDHSRAIRACVVPCQGIGTADRADPITPGSRPLNLIWHHLTLVWQPPIVGRRVVKPGEHSQERQHPLADKPHDDDDMAGNARVLLNGATCAVSVPSFTYFLNYSNINKLVLRHLEMSFS